MILIKTTYPNKPRECKKFIQWIIGWKFAACINKINWVKSYYKWEWKIETSQEIILFIKTLPEKKEACVSHIKKNHPYQVPEIQILHIDETDANYLNWVKDIL